MSAIDTLTWAEFSKESLEFLDISKQLDDTWSWEVKNAEVEGQSYLRYTKKLTHPLSQELIQIEYHIVYSISYQVPMLYLQAYANDGKPMSLENVWTIFQHDQDTKYSREDMLSILTQMDHPIYFRPFICLHPCRTSEILAATPKSCNRVLTFISVMGPYMQLKLDNRYGLHYQDKSNEE
ncbi:ubiquitin-like-conjugating enzyme ATG10 [Calliphora vicina]|uniref:ubiquitin-like-conjugating enzyme ATG10 n=1 Tax=Calliphora vicina TaxID=7373 RepID=UPI00325C013D